MQKEFEPVHYDYYIYLMLEEMEKSLGRIMTKYGVANDDNDIELISEVMADSLYRAEDEVGHELLTFKLTKKKQKELMTKWSKSRKFQQFYTAWTEC